MTRSGGPTPPPGVPAIGEPVTPPPEIALSVIELASDSDKTEEWTLAGAPRLHQATPPPAPAVPNGISTPGSIPEGPELAPLSETPTAPLPVDPGATEAEAPAMPTPRSIQILDAPTASAVAGPEDPVIDEDLEIVESSPTPPAPVAGLPSIPAPLTPPLPRVAVESARTTPPLPFTLPTPGPSVPAAPGKAAASAPPIPAAATAALLHPTEAWAEPLAARPRRKRSKPWFEEVFDEDYLRTLPFMTADQTLREVTFLHDGLKAPPEGELLDVGCGYGRHAIELAQRGFRVTGIDLSLPLLIRAADESQRRALSVNFVHADMREISFENQFDGAYSMLTSFGYFDEETNMKVASGICRALKPGGRFLIDVLNRDYIVKDLPTRVWWEGDGCLVLEEVDFNFHTSRVTIRRSVVFQDGRQLEHDISIRAYTLHELGKLLRNAGFRVLDVSGSLATKGHFFGATSRNLIMLCEKPTS